MAVQQLNFQGINRAITDFSSTSACEELINLRPTGTGLVPVKPFFVKMAGVTYTKVFIHKATNATNYIGLYGQGDTTYVNVLYEDGSLKANLFEISSALVQQSVSFLNVIAGMHFAAVGNYILFSIKDDEDEFYANYAFLWNGTEYKEKEANIPSIQIIPEFSTPELLVSPVTPTWGADADDAEIKEQISSGLNAIEEENKEYCLGPIIVAIAFKTTDGNTFWTNKWLICDPFPVPPEGAVPNEGEFPEGYVIDEDSGIAQYFPTFFNTHEYGLHVSTIGLTRQIQAAGRKLTLSLTMNTSEWDEDSSLLRSVEIYASRPSLHVDPVKAWGEQAVADSGTQAVVFFHVVLPQVQYSKMDLGNQLFYFQKSIPLEKLKDGTVTESLVFGGNIQTTNETLKVDAGSVTHYGDLLAYNARFHFFKSASKVQIGMPDFIFNSGTGQEELADVFVVYNDGQKDIPVYCGTKMLPADTDAPAIMVISPSLKVKEVVTQQPAGDVMGTTRVYPMKESSRYNYSYCDDGGLSNPYRIPLYSPTNEKSYAIVDEPAAINVTEQYNPFVFKVEHSYLAPGNILDVQPQMVAVRDVTYGDYPLNVFTDRGLYALLQGNGTVLYGNFRSISNLVTTSNSIPTENGTFFIAAGGLWLVAGDNAVLVSDALSLGPHKFIRNCPGYQAISNSVYNIGPFESKVIFEEYVDGASLCYNRFRDELIVSNPLYDYSYVLSLKYRQWFKINLALSQDVVGSSIAAVGFKGTKAVAGLTAEVPVDTRFLHDYRDGEIEIEVNLQGTTVSCALTVEFQEVGQDYSSIVNHMIARWNTEYGNILHAGAYTEPTGDFVYIPMTFVQSIPGVTAIEGSITMLSDSHETHSFTFPDPTVDIVDFSDETEDTSALVHLQSRPFSFSGYMYTHIHRIISMVRASLSSSDILVVSLYGSDDLQEWVLLSYAGRSSKSEDTPLRVSQLRTPPAARSWRYYTICIGGNIPADTDFGPVMVDYQPVIRRLG